MLLLIPICLVAIGDVGFAAPGSIGTLGGTGYSSVLEDSAEANLLGVGASKYGVGCLPGEVAHIDGTCVTPHVTRSIYVYAAPKLPAKYIPPPPIPKPRINYNVVFVRTPENLHGFEPIVIPPPQEKTIVYVLTKNGQIGQHVIEVPAAYNHSPEVYYVNYNEGENPVLPGGIHLQEALSTAATHDGHLIGGPGIVSEEIGAGLVKDIDAGFSDGVGDAGGLIGGGGLGAGYAVGDVVGGGFGGGFGGSFGGGFGGGGVIDGFGGGSVTVHSGGHESAFGGGYSGSSHSSVISGISGNKIQSGLGGILNSKGIRPIYKPSKLNVKFR